MFILDCMDFLSLPSSLILLISAAPNICCYYFDLVEGVWSLFCDEVLTVLSTFAICSLGKKVLLTLLFVLNLSLLCAQ